jgi:hypothetical protein
MKNLTLFLITLTMASALCAMDEKKKQKALEAFYDAQTKTGKGKEKAERNFARLYEQGTDSETVHAAAATLGLGTPQEKTESRKAALEIAKRRIAAKQAPLPGSGSSSGQFVDTVAPLFYAGAEATALAKDKGTLEKDIATIQEQLAATHPLNIVQRFDLGLQLQEKQGMLRALSIRHAAAKAKAQNAVSYVQGKTALKSEMKNLIERLNNVQLDTSANANLTTLETTFIELLRNLFEQYDVSNPFEDAALKTMEHEFNSAISAARSLSAFNQGEFDQLEAERLNIQRELDIVLNLPRTTEEEESAYKQAFHDVATKDSKLRQAKAKLENYRKQFKTSLIALRQTTASQEL